MGEAKRVRCAFTHAELPNPVLGAVGTGERPVLVLLRDFGLVNAREDDDRLA